MLKPNSIRCILFIFLYSIEDNDFVLCQNKAKINERIICIPEHKKEIYFISEINDSRYEVIVDWSGKIEISNVPFCSVDLQLVNDLNHYPILIKNIHVTRSIIDLGELPLFFDPFGYSEDWASVDDSTRKLMSRMPKSNEKRDSLENTYTNGILYNTLKYSFETICLKEDSGCDKFCWRSVVIDFKRIRKKKC